MPNFEMNTFYDPAVAVPTLVGSLLSCITSGLIFVSYIFLPQIPHFRHILILNLAGADFFNGLNNSISGIYLFVHGGLQAGPWCTANGFAGQLTVQGTDFAILLIAITTVLALRGRSPGLSDVTWKSKLLVTICVWFVPVTTAVIAAGMNAYSPVSGNWCWISQDKPVLRYALNHGWRFAIILITISLYIHLAFYFRSEFREIRQLSQKRPSLPTLGLPHKLAENTENDLPIETYPTDTKYPYPEPSEVYQEPKFKMVEYDEVDDEFAMRRGSTMMERHFRGDSVPLATSKALTNITSYSNILSSPTAITPSNYSHRASLERKQHEIRKMLMLNAYPIAYVILWIPGILNRILELSGGESRTLRILQSSTQYVGLANAITYGYNEGIKRQLGTWWERRKNREGSIRSRSSSWPSSREGGVSR